MTVVNPKSISGINSITMASGSDDLLTIHSNNTTERVRVNNSGDVIVGSGVTLSPDGDAFFTGVCTATSFSGDGSALTGLSGVSVANQSDNRVITNTGTTDALNAEANLVFTGTRLGLNQTSPAPLNGDGTGMIHVAGGNPELVLERTTSGTESKASIRITDGEDFKIAVKDGSGSTIDAFAIDTGTGNITASGTVAATSYTGDGSSLTGISAISNAQQFRLAANQAGSSSAGTVFTNWEECDTDYQAIGSNWSQSSGVFSCSTTGIYVCYWSLVINGTNTGDAFDPNIQISTNSGGAYTTRSRGWSHIANSYVNRTTIANQFMFDVSNTSTFRLRYRQSQDNDLASGTTVAGSSTETLTNIMFIRLGNT